MNYAFISTAKTWKQPFVIQVFSVLNNYYVMTDQFNRREQKALMMRYILSVHIVHIYVYCFLLFVEVFYTLHTVFQPW